MTGAQVALAAGGGVALAIVIAAIWEHKAHAATQPCKCPDGTPCPGGNSANCPSPQLGNNDPDSPPGGWVYNGKVGDPASIQAAIGALKAAGDPCQKSAEQAVRNLQAILGLAQTTSAGANAVSPPGTDGRYGGDVYKAASQYDSSMPQPCYSNSNPGARPSWWGAPGTFTNP